MEPRKAPPGAGRKPKLKPGERSKPLKTGLTPREFLEAVMNDPTIEAHRRDRAALALFGEDRRSGAAPAEAPIGKRAAAAQAAKVAAGGRFAPRSPPRLVVNNDGGVDHGVS